MIRLRYGAFDSIKEVFIDYYEEHVRAMRWYVRVLRDDRGYMLKYQEVILPACSICKPELAALNGVRNS